MPEHISIVYSETGCLFNIYIYITEMKGEHSRNVIYVKYLNKIFNKNVGQSWSGDEITVMSSGLIL